MSDSKTKTARPIFLDYQATTPTDPRVVEAMLPYFNEQFGNPHSVHHVYGRDAAEAVERARARIAALIGAEAREIVFTSGATESNNLAIKGACRFLAERKGHLITLASEHKCVLESCKRMEREGYRLTILDPGPDGLIDPARIAAAIEEDTALVSVMAVNNEIGVIQPLAEIGALCRERGVLFHCDAAQAAGKVPLDVNALSIDLLSLSGHKMYGPKGIGVLYVRRRPRVRLEPLFDGGGQERGHRSGTLPAPLCVGLGRAAEIALAEMAEEAERLAGFSARFRALLEAGIEGVQVNGSLEARFAGNLNVSIPGVAAEALIEAMPEIAVSTGSACTSASVEPSYVLRSLGLPEARARGSLRIGFGRFTTEAEVERAAEIMVAAVRRLQGRASEAAE